MTVLMSGRSAMLVVMPRMIERTANRRGGALPRSGGPQ